MQHFSSQVEGFSSDAVRAHDPVSGPALTLVRPPLHVLFLIDHLIARGGGEGNLLKIVELMPRDLIRCSVATFRIDPEIRKNIPVPVHVLPLRRVYDLGAARAAFQLQGLIRKERVDIVQTYFETSNLWGGLVAKLSGAVLLSCRRDMGILRSTKHHVAYRLINRLADRVLAVSEEVKKYCIDVDRVSPSKISVIYNGVDVQKIAATSALPVNLSSDLTGPQHIITCVANLRHIKGIDLLIRATKKVCSEIPGVVLVIAGIVGDRGYSQEVRALVRSLGMENNVKLLGFIEDPVPLLKISTAFCLLSRSEGFCNALLEAMACGVPSVVSRVGGNPEAIVDGENGFLVPVEDPDAAAERLLFLLRNPEQARLMGLAARNTVISRFSADDMIHNLICLYNELIAQRPKKEIGLQFRSVSGKTDVGA
jgi:glycosyltransferase involved in cell wall biosynthesis